MAKNTKKKINSKQKGKNYELEIVHKLREYGYKEARRTSQFCGKSGDASDVIGLPGIHIECKHYKTQQFNYDWLDQAIADSKAKEEVIPAVFHRTDQRDTVVTLRLDDFMTLYKKAYTKQEPDINAYPEKSISFVTKQDEPSLTDTNYTDRFISCQEEQRKIIKEMIAIIQAKEKHDQEEYVPSEMER